MLDAYIIDRIRRERGEQRDDGRAPLRIERRQERPPATPGSREEESDRGVTNVDYRL